MQQLYLLSRRRLSDENGKHLHGPCVIPAGSRQLFLGDVQSGIKKFGALFHFFSQEVVLSPNRQHLDELPAQARENVLSVVAAYIPYYHPLEVGVWAYKWARGKCRTMQLRSLAGLAIVI